MAVNKVTYAGNTLIDLTTDTLTSSDQLVTGTKAHTKSGASVTGTNPYEKAATDTAVTNALTALAEKGVDTTGKGLADIAGLVAGIQAGGGGGFELAFEQGNMTMAADATINRYNEEQTFSLPISADLLPLAYAFKTNTTTYNDVQVSSCVSYLPYTVSNQFGLRTHLSYSRRKDSSYSSITNEILSIIKPFHDKGALYPKLGSLTTTIRKGLTVYWYVVGLKGATYEEVYEAMQ